MSRSVGPLHSSQQRQGAEHLSKSKEAGGRAKQRYTQRNKALAHQPLSGCSKQYITIPASENAAKNVKIAGEKGMKACTRMDEGASINIGRVLMTALRC
jgi:hypothetical protein